MNKKLVDLLHIILCDKKHIYSIEEMDLRDPAFCYYHAEDCIAGGEEMSDHLYWLDNFETFKVVMKLHDDREAEKFMQECLEISKRAFTIVGPLNERAVFLNALLKFGDKK
jgi:hypothetical protein